MYSLCLFLGALQPRCNSMIRITDSFLFLVIEEENIKKSKKYLKIPDLYCLLISK